MFKLWEKGGIPLRSADIILRESRLRDRVFPGYWVVSRSEGEALRVLHGLDPGAFEARARIASFVQGKLDMNRGKVGIYIPPLFRERLVLPAENRYVDFSKSEYRLAAMSNTIRSHPAGRTLLYLINIHVDPVRYTLGPSSRVAGWTAADTSRSYLSTHGKRRGGAGVARGGTLVRPGCRTPPRPSLFAEDGDRAMLCVEDTDETLPEYLPRHAVPCVVVPWFMQSIGREPIFGASRPSGPRGAESERFQRKKQELVRADDRDRGKSSYPPPNLWAVAPCPSVLKPPYRRLVTSAYVAGLRDGPSRPPSSDLFPSKEALRAYAWGFGRVPEGVAERNGEMRIDTLERIIVARAEIYVQVAKALTANPTSSDAATADIIQAVSARLPLQTERDGYMHHLAFICLGKAMSFDKDLCRVWKRSEYEINYRLLYSLMSHRSHGVDVMLNSFKDVCASFRERFDKHVMCRLEKAIRAFSITRDYDGALQRSFAHRGHTVYTETRFMVAEFENAVSLSNDPAILRKGVLSNGLLYLTFQQYIDLILPHVLRIAFDEHMQATRPQPLTSARAYMPVHRRHGIPDYLNTALKAALSAMNTGMRNLDREAFLGNLTGEPVGYRRLFRVYHEVYGKKFAGLGGDVVDLGDTALKTIAPPCMYLAMYHRPLARPNRGKGLDPSDSRLKRHLDYEEHSAVGMWAAAVGIAKEDISNEVGKIWYEEGGKSINEWEQSTRKKLEGAYAFAVNKGAKGHSCGSLGHSAGKHASNDCRGMCPFVGVGPDGGVQPATEADIEEIGSAMDLDRPRIDSMIQYRREARPDDSYTDPEEKATRARAPCAAMIGKKTVYKPSQWTSIKIRRSKKPNPPSDQGRDQEGESCIADEALDQWMKQFEEKASSREQEQEEEESDDDAVYTLSDHLVQMGI